MNQKKPKSGKKLHAPKSKLGKVLLNLVITAVIGFVYFYVALPALNFQSEDFYTFVGLLCVVYYRVRLYHRRLPPGGLPW